MNCPIPNFNGATVEVWEWISNFIPHFIGHVITRQFWDLSQTLLAKRQMLTNPIHQYTHFKLRHVCIVLLRRE